MCDSCQLLRINGHVCHELGCPRTPRVCQECGKTFEGHQYQKTCSDECYRNYFGLDQEIEDHEDR